jgi:anti-sigma regulatory factor (Ser/Thr protein kinase)
VSSATFPADMASVDVALPHEVSAVAAARRDLDGFLLHRGVGADRRHDARLVLSELISNAIRHAPPLSAGHLKVSWWLDASGVHLEVTDGCGATEPHQVTDAHPESLGGRGLAIVSVLTSHWGVRGDTDSRTVYAVVPG